MIYADKMRRELLIPWIQPSPLGPMLLLARESGALLLATWPEAEEPALTLSGCASALGCELMPLRALTQDAAGALDGLDTEGLPHEAAGVAVKLDDYLRGRSTELALPIDLSLVRSQFRRQVLEALYAVPRLATTTYGELARRLGRMRGAARAVGQAVGSNPLAIVVPCHRVIASDGSLGGYSGGLWRKRWLLTLEGYKVPEGGWEPRRSGAAVAVVV